MSTLYLIRHGQAGFASPEYDILSPRGAEQMQHLGAYLAERRVAIDAIYSGPRRRQILSAQALVEAARQQGATISDAQVLEDLDEFPFGEILQAAVSQGIRADYVALREELGGDPLHHPRGFEQLFRLSVGRWVNAQVAGPESFVDFVARIERGLTTIRSHEGRGRRIAVVTSAGVIAATARAALGLDGPTAMRLCLQLYNSSLSTFRYREDLLSLISLNCTPHLTSDALVTLR